MKNKNMIIGLIIGIAMAFLWSVCFVNILKSVAGICIGIFSGISFGVAFSLIFKDKNK